LRDSDSSQNVPGREHRLIKPLDRELTQTRSTRSGIRSWPLTFSLRLNPARARREGLVPGILYGGTRDNLPIQLKHNELLHSLEVEAFHSAIITLKYGDIEQDVVIRSVDMHPYRQQVMHVDLQRIDENATLRMTVPIHFVGEEDCPGVKLDGGIVTKMFQDTEIQCLPKDLPESLEVDISELELNASVHLSDLKLPEGVELMHFVSGGEDLAIAAVAPPKTSAADEAEDLAAEEAAADGEEGADAPAGDDAGGDDSGGDDS